MSSKGLPHSRKSGVSDPEFVDKSDFGLFTGTRKTTEEDSDVDELTTEELSERGSRRVCFFRGAMLFGRMGLSVGLVRLEMGVVRSAKGVERPASRAFNGRPAGHSGVTRRRDDTEDPKEL